MALIQATHAYNIIYVYTADDADHKDIVKIGKTMVYVEPNKFEQLSPNCPELTHAANERICEQTGTFGASFTLLYTELAHIKNQQGEELRFYDTDVHQVLLNSGYHKHFFPKLGDKQPQEWFDISPSKINVVKDAIAAVKQGRSSIQAATNDTRPTEIVFRREQREAIDTTMAHFATAGKMLWNAKMRFGKTLCALEVVRRLGYEKTLILTHRPAVKSGWFDDFKLIRFENYEYGSKPSANTKNGQPQVGEKFDTLLRSGNPFIYFASMQDLRGSWDNASLKKNADVFATHWDMVIIDEAHEGINTTLGQNVINTLRKRCKHFLYLSGTPYNILSQFREDEIYTWDYINEQAAKEGWNDPTHPNPYEGLARLNIRTYNLGAVFNHYNHSDEDYFEFSEFFRTWTGYTKIDGTPLPLDAHIGAFVHEEDVRAFLKLLYTPSQESYYPFSREEYKAYFAHTFWVLPGVKAAAALSKLLQTDDFFSNFCVVNVAGEGDKIERLGDTDDAHIIERQERDCLKKVKDAIAHNERTITLSCGRLTTGVSIEEWTAVFMLSGSYNTKAASYLQTIFRAQTPYKHTPGIKTDCYAFDFAPDRTLTVIDEFIRTQATRSGNIGNVRLSAESFMKFCSVIAIDGSKTTDYNAQNFMQQVNRVYTQYVVQKGFHDRRLYQSITSAKGKDLDWLKEIGNILSGKANKTDGKKTVDISKQGLDGKNAKKEQNPKRDTITPQSSLKKKHTLSPDEEARGLLLKILNIISVRLPMMIFGMVDGVETLSLKSFINGIDPASWNVFMPNGFKKEHFLSLEHFYNNNVFISAALNIISRAKAIDRLPITERVRQLTSLIGTFHYPDRETVLTPWRVVNMHLCKTLGGYNFYDEKYQNELTTPRFIRQGNITAQVFENTDARILEINSKSGVYPLWVAYTLFRTHGGSDSMGQTEQLSLWKQVVERNLFVICQTPMAQHITRRVLAGFHTDICPNTTCFTALPEILRGKDQAQRNKLIKNIMLPSTYGNKHIKNTMKFDAVVGNPPYQITKGDNGSGADALYHLFLDLGKDLAPLNTMIHPARFLFNAGKTPKIWNEAFLNNPHYKVVEYWANSAEVFPQVDVKGGIAITLYNKQEDFGAIGFFSTFKELRSIKDKVHAEKITPFSDIVSARELYSLTQALYDENPSFENRQSKGHKYSLGSNVFDIFPELFLNECPKDKANEMVRVFGRQNSQRCFKWVKQSYITHPDSFYAYKVIIPQSNGSGAIGEVLTTPIIGVPIIGHTDTFMSIGCFDNEAEAEACMKYIKTKFARTLLGTLKVTQANTRNKWQNVPLQDFTPNSDIDWTQSIADIDQQLYKKYNLSEEEIKFIEEKILEME